MLKPEVSLLSYLTEESEIVKRVNASNDYLESLETAFENAPVEDKPQLNIMIAREQAKREDALSLLECCRDEMRELIDAF